MSLQDQLNKIPCSKIEYIGQLAIKNYLAVENYVKNVGPFVPKDGFFVSENAAKDAELENQIDLSQCLLDKQIKMLLEEK